MEEVEWRPIEGYSDYSVSNIGTVYNERFDCPMALSKTTQGLVKVALTNKWGRRTFSLAPIVAYAFVESSGPLSDQVVILNGVQDDLRASNLVWRPKWFNWKYVRQLKIRQPRHYHNLPVINRRTGVVYENIIEAGKAEGLLFEDIWRSTYSEMAVYPNRDIFDVVK